ncbi:MAG TPA: hypothetical protein VFT69_19695 [Pseudolabrys sp.]|jgi:hypothetical protein|nr:hypothetical protein [Pseudolabrys sp.]
MLLIFLAGSVLLGVIRKLKGGSFLPEPRPGEDCYFLDKQGRWWRQEESGIVEEAFRRPRKASISGSKVRRVISLILALCLSAAGAAGLIYFVFFAPLVRGLMVMGAGSLFVAGTVWLYEDYKPNIGLIHVGTKIRTVAIWATGLFASGIIGGVIGGQFSSGYESEGFPGILAGMLAFACARLWLGERKAK